jgi:hypothetical protein
MIQPANETMIMAKAGRMCGDHALMKSQLPMEY